MLTNEQVAKIKARCDAATKGPWGWDATDGSMMILSPTVDWMDQILACAPCPSCHKAKLNCSAPRKQDADFIAHSREDMDKLGADNDELRAENAKLRAEIGRGQC